MLRSHINTVLCNQLANLWPVQYQTLRWKRKPRKPFWLGTAKSKRFRVPVAPVLPEEEKKELIRLAANYKSAMKSIRQYFNERAVEQASAQVTAQMASTEEIEESLKRNEQWNAECALIREERLKREDAKHEDVALRIIDEKEKAKRVLLENVEAMVRLEKARSKDFVTLENLDAKIEECLDSRTDYNYAIDLKGNMYTGFQTEMKIVPREEETADSPQNVSNTA